PLADHVFSCAPADVQRLREWLGPSSVSGIPNAIRPPARTVVAPRDGPLLFCGNLSYMPNVEAARWLCERVLPRLPGVHAAIVGRDPGAEVRGLERDPRVVIAGDVPEVGSWYERASLAVVPVLRGGGSRIKLIEAFAHRRAVVSTTAGAAGLPWPVKGSPVVLADAPETFAGACRALLEDPERSDRLAAEGQRLVKANATVAVVAARIERLVRAVCGSDAVATT
ncbi:MAG: glycosyltransferase family 4 protein, partial [Solirubrobacteraceae bacterium]